jgi:cytochrome P450
MTNSAPPERAELYYDPYDYDVDTHAQAVWSRMREEAPLYWNEKFGFFALSRYDDVLRAVLDTDRFSSAHATVLEMMTPATVGFPMMIFMDPPEHSWHRKLVSRAFTTRTVAALEERVTRLCASLLDSFVGAAGFDYLDDFGAIIPPTIILALLGFPEGFVEDWRHGIDTMFHNEQGETGFRRDAVDPFEPEPGHQDLIGVGGALGSGVFQVLPELLALRRKQPQEDLLSVLVHTQLEEGGETRPLNDAEIFSFVQLIGIAGTETVARLLGWVAVLLDRYPDQRDLLVTDPGLVANAIEECLRYEAPSPVNGRWVTEDVEFHGQTVPKDSKLLLLNGSANRDERHFPNADRFDVRRKIDRHLAFGYGAHFCIGAALARIEGQIALRETLRRFPRWQVDYDHAEMVRTSTVRGYGKVPITFGGRE